MSLRLWSEPDAWMNRKVLVRTGESARRAARTPSAEVAGQELSKSRNPATSRRLVLLSDFGRNGQNAALPHFRSEFQRNADEARKGYVPSVNEICFR